MAKGKHGAAAAGRRLAEAEVRIADLTAAAARVEQEHAIEVRELKAQIQNLNGRMAKGIREASAAAIMAAQDNARAQVAEIQEREAQRMRDVLRFIFTHAVGISMPANQSGGAGKWAELADLAGVGFGELLGLSPEANLNYQQRRANTKKANQNADAKRWSDARR